MPNQILRAGPFASLGDYFVNRPATPTSQIRPVNCATNDWLNDTWKAYTEVTGDDPTPADYTVGLPQTFNYSVTDPSDFTSTIEFQFYYQAAIDATLNVSAVLTTSDALNFEARVTADVAGSRLIDANGDGAGSGTLTVNQSITLPAAVRPLLVLIQTRHIGEDGAGTFTGTLTVS